MSAQLFIIYCATILVTRVVLWFWPKHSPMIGRFQPHHYMHGLILIALYFLIPNPIILAVGLGLFVDEIPLFFIFGTWDWPHDHWKQYHSWQSVISIVCISLFGFWILV